MTQTHSQLIFNTGDREVDDSLNAAHERAMRTTSDHTDPALFPAEIWEVHPGDDAAGRIVEVVYADGKVTRVAAPG